MDPESDLERPRHAVIFHDDIISFLRPLVEFHVEWSEFVLLVLVCFLFVLMLVRSLLGPRGFPSCIRPTLHIMYDVYQPCG